jgi:hypothetical protein
MCSTVRIDICIKDAVREFGVLANFLSIFAGSTALPHSHVRTYFSLAAFWSSFFLFSLGGFGSVSRSWEGLKLRLTAIFSQHGNPAALRACTPLCGVQFPDWIN